MSSNTEDELPDGVDEEEVEEVHECPYCGEMFESAVDEGVHRSEKHLNNDDDISRGGKSDDNIVREWKE